MLDVVATVVVEDCI
jgi:hypothetical protein